MTWLILSFDPQFILELRNNYKNLPGHLSKLLSSNFVNSWIKFNSRRCERQSNVFKFYFLGIKLNVYFIRWKMNNYHLVKTFRDRVKIYDTCCNLFLSKFC